MNKATKRNSIETFGKVYVQIKSKEDETKWKVFLKEYFPNHYASKLLDDNLVIDMDAFYSGRAYQNKSIAVSPNGYGAISLRFAHYGGYQQVDNFEEFKLTSCYNTIIKNGPFLGKGTPEIIKITL